MDSVELFVYVIVGCAVSLFILFLWAVIKNPTKFAENAEGRLMHEKLDKIIRLLEELKEQKK